MRAQAKERKARCNAVSCDAKAEDHELVADGPRLHRLIQLAEKGQGTEKVFCSRFCFMQTLSPDGAFSRVLCSAIGRSDVSEAMHSVVLLVASLTRTDSTCRRMR